MINLKYNFTFNDLYSSSKLKKLDQIFLNFLEPSLRYQLIKQRENFIKWNLEHSQLAIIIAECLENFLADFFQIEEELNLAKEKISPLATIYECKRSFVQRYALKTKKDSNQNYINKLSKFISPNLEEFSTLEFEQIYSEYVLKWQKENDQEKIEIAAQYAVWACLNQNGITKHKSGILFKFPHKLDLNNLVPLEVIKQQCYERDGFKLTDKGCSLNFAYDQSNYCIHCHNQGKDSCSKGGVQDKKGCPLDEKISEMNFLKSKGSIIGSLAMAIIDNPMLAATGHRICNDCMKSCIFQKQEPVDIPQIETRTLKDVLELPWGFEIYSLLTRWNPLSFFKPYPKENNGSKVLIAGMGPAGFTLAHYLLNEGHVVVGIDGLKIEPLDKKFLNPIKFINEYFEELDERIISGFGGVMEYGITNRWNKNFLLLIRLLLERRKNFKLFGGIRLGSNITPKQAFDLGFQHIALALGAGSPKFLSIENGMAKGVRTASDFLMSLQLGKAYKLDSLTNLQIRMPVVVIGGGLTALDAATEAMAYYPMLVKKFSNLHKGEVIDEEAKELIEHNQLFKNSNSNLNVMKSLGGVKILYRNKLQQAPSYRLNHEELSLGLKEGIEFVENVTPIKIILDAQGNACAVEAIQNGETIKIPAKTILIAAGTVPNIILSEEFPEYLSKEDGYFKHIADKFITYNDGKNSMSFFGDLHSEYAGNVVKAMASAKHGYSVVSNLLKPDSTDSEDFFKILEQKLVPTLLAINRLTSNIVELIINSPLSAENFKPGQFFRLQNFANPSLPLIEPIALTGAKIEGDNISTIVLEIGNSSNLCSKFQINAPVILMGPTGEGTEINPNENVMLIGGGLGNAVLFSIGQAFKKMGSNVLYFAGYRKLEDRYKISEIESAADQIIWSCDEGLLDITRSQDLSFRGNILESILNFAKNNPNKLKSIDRIIVIGSDKMMRAIKEARSNALEPYLNKNHKAIASINSPMQCMMKEICGQCIQRHVDPVTFQESYVFSCTNQDQEIDRVDFVHLESRLNQNKILEKFIPFKEK